MDGEKVKKPIKEIVPLLFSSEKGMQEQAFEDLCEYFRDEHIEEIYDRLTGRGDAPGGYWLLRYLVRVECPLGFEKLFALLQNESEIIREEARVSLEKINESHRLELLIQMLELERKEDLLFAIEQLGRLRHRKAVLPLLDIIESAEDEEIQAEILRALGRIRDPASLRSLKKFADFAQGTVQEEALVAMGKFANNLPIRFIKRCLESENRRVREIIYLAILRFRQKRWEGYVAKGLTQEEDERLKMNVLSAVRAIRTHGLFKAVLSLASFDESLKVRMLATTVLKRIKSKAILNWLCAETRNRSFELKEGIFRQMAEYRKERLVFNVFARRYAQLAVDSERENKLKIVILACMGRLYDKRVPAFLLKVVNEDKKFAYAAALALRDQIEIGRKELFETLMELEPGTHHLILELCLDMIARTDQKFETAQWMSERIHSFLRSNDERICALAVRCLARSGSREDLLRVMGVAGRSSGKRVRKTALKAVTALVSYHPEELQTVLTTSLTVQGLFSTTSRLFRTVSCSEDQYRGMMENLMEKLDYFQLHLPGAHLMKQARILVLMKDLSLTHKTYFVALLRDGRWNKTQHRRLLMILNRLNLHEMGGASVDFMARQYLNAEPEAKILYLTFFQKMSVRSKVIEDTLMRAITLETDNRVRTGVYGALNHWLELAGGGRGVAAG